jgi:hypothetical protein
MPAVTPARPGPFRWFTSEARTRRAKRRHLLSGSHCHREDALSAMRHGLPIDVMVDLHDLRDDTDASCKHPLGGLNQTFGRLAGFMATGGNADHVRRLIAHHATSPSRHRDLIHELYIFGGQAQRVLRDTSQWGRSTDWVEVYVAALEAGKRHDLLAMVPADIYERHAPDAETWEALRHLSESYRVPAQDLAEYLPDLRRIDYDRDRPFARYGAWAHIARWHALHGERRTRLMLAAGLSATEGDAFEGDDTALALLAALRGDRPVLAV